MEEQGQFNLDPLWQLRNQKERTEVLGVTMEIGQFGNFS